MHYYVVHGKSNICKSNLYYDNKSRMNDATSRVTTKEQQNVKLKI